MNNKVEKRPLNEHAAVALRDLSAKGKNTFHIDDWTSAVGGNRVRACQYLKELRKDGRVARVADDAYLIV